MMISSSEQWTFESWVGETNDNNMMSVNFWKIRIRKLKVKLKEDKLGYIKIWHISEYLLMKKKRFHLNILIVFMHNTFKII